MMNNTTIINTSHTNTNNNSHTSNPKHGKLKILTVGDGDFTFSLALKRAYPQNVTVTASTLLSSKEELIRTYSNAPETIHELQNVWKENLLFGVDATKLEDTLLPSWNNKEAGKSHCLEGEGGKHHEELQFDIIIFNHPHLGDAALHESEQMHAQRHYSLLSHYFHSAKQFLVQGCSKRRSSLNEERVKEDSVGGGGGGGRIHVCLCGKQPQTWNIIQAAKRHGLQCISEDKTALPVHQWLFPNNNIHEGSSSSTNNMIIEVAAVQEHYKAPRRYRNGKLGSKHFLGKYGYRHRRTGGDLFTGNDLDMVVEQSINFVFREKGINSTITRLKQMNSGSVNNDTKNEDVVKSEHDIECPICGIVLKSKAALKAHMESPATPDIMLRPNKTQLHYAKINKKKDDHKEDNKDSPNSKKPKYSIHNTNTTTDSSKSNEQMLLYSSKSNDTISTKKQDIIHPEAQNQMKLAQDQIAAHFQGKRLRWVCRQNEMSVSKHIKSKNHCESMIKSGQVLVNDEIVLDSSRILKTHDIVTLIDISKSTSLSSSDKILKKNKPIQDHGVKIVKVTPYLDSAKIIVAFKPVGIRTVGCFSDTTLEMIVRSLVIQSESLPSHIEVICHSITKLDTGCAGLCVLIVTVGQSGQLRTNTGGVADEDRFQLNYEFTALVHGKVPTSFDTGVFLKIPENNGSRRWNKKEKAMNKNSDDTITSGTNEATSLESEGKIEISTIAGEAGNWISVQCTDRFDYHNKEHGNESKRITATVSTVVLKSSFDSGRLSNLLCFLLRKIGYPVVNDRFCKRELTSLPRLMKNILKNKLCIGCYTLHFDIMNEESIHATTVRVDPQCRTLCSFWRDTFKNHVNKNL